MIRYVGLDPRFGGVKDITPDESAALAAVGLGRVIVYQPRQSFVPGAGDSGDGAAAVALWQATEAGMPAGRPIYFAVDGDTSQLDSLMWAEINAFFAAAGDRLGVDRVGVYGGIHTIERLRAAGLATWYWQTFAWSAGQWADGLHLRQFDNNNPLCGGTVDYDRAMTRDYGQW